MSIFFIVVGCIVFLIGLYLVFSFLGEFKVQIDALNEIVRSDEFGILVNLREELDELNNSYYDILERQDERISNLEQLNDISESEKEFGEAEDNSLNDEHRINRNEIISLLSEGKSVEDVAIKLGVDRSTVELIYSMDVHESRG